jgi:hypothetical protein
MQLNTQMLKDVSYFVQMNNTGFCIKRNKFYTPNNESFGVKV